MPKHNPPNKHHYLPIFYLGHWARASDQKVVAFTKPYGDKVKPLSRHAGGVGYSMFLYETRGMPSETAQEMETHFFQPVDTMAAVALKEMLEAKTGDRLGGKARKAWTRFLLSLQFRMPEDMESLRANTRDDWILSVPEMEEQYAVARRPDDPESLLDFLNLQDGSLFEQSAMHLARTLIDHRNISNTITNMHWSVVNVEGARHELLTSDRPVIMPSNLGAEQSFIILPVGPTTLFVALESRERSVLRRLPKNDLVARCNRRVVSNANKLVIGRNESQLAFIQKWMGREKSPTMLQRLQELRREKVTEARS